MFDGGVLSYRNTDEGSLFKTLSFLEETYGTDFYSDWSFFIVNHSEYIDWSNEESISIDEKGMKDYVFLTPDDVIEILSTYPPSIEIK